MTYRLVGESPTKSGYLYWTAVEAGGAVGLGIATYVSAKRDRDAEPISFLGAQAAGVVGAVVIDLSLAGLLVLTQWLTKPNL